MTEGPQRRSLSEGEVDPSGGAIFLVLGLFIGVIFRRLQRKLRLPYTVILLVLGVIIGAIEFNAQYVPLLHSDLWLSSHFVFLQHGRFGRFCDFMGKLGPSSDSHYFPTKSYFWKCLCCR